MIDISTCCRKLQQVAKTVICDAKTNENSSVRRGSAEEQPCGPQDSALCSAAADPGMWEACVQEFAFFRQSVFSNCLGKKFKLS